MSGLPENLKSMFARDATVLAGIENGSVRVIPLTKGLVTIVDAEDYEWLGRRKWCAAIFSGKWYACRGSKKNRKSSLILMHREILGLVKKDGKMGDHKNRQSLDNRRGNLRVASPTLNSYNCNMNCNNTSGYRGVYWKKANNNWQVQIGVNKKLIYVGSYPNKVVAALAYDKAAIKYYGNDAYLNFPKEV